MPELPDVETYRERLAELLTGRSVEAMRIASPFLLRTVSPAPSSFEGAVVVAVQRLGKRLAFVCQGGTALVVHLMVAGRLQWREPKAKMPARVGLWALDFAHGTLILTEASMKRRAALWLVGSSEELAAHNPGGLEPLQCGVDAFRAALRKERHTLKRTLTDPHLLSGIGNAYSDEILHHAQLSPTQMSDALNDDQSARLWASVQHVLQWWLQHLRAECPVGSLPQKVTAFRGEMAVHGKAGQACPRCASPVQRIRYADNETNYCATCQTGGRLLADRALSRLLKDDFPRSLDDLEALRTVHRTRGLTS
jgi:formamidopyrimidine-DNA glycosylase